MIVQSRCTICHTHVDAAGIEECGACGFDIHTSCAEFVRSFDCPECADELEIGAVEF